MTVYLLKAHEPSPDLRHPDVTRRDREPDPLDRLRLELHATLEAAQAAGQAGYDAKYDNHHTDSDPEEDEYHQLDWGVTGMWAFCDMAEAEYEIEAIDGFVAEVT